MYTKKNIVFFIIFLGCVRGESEKSQKIRDWAAYPPQGAVRIEISGLKVLKARVRFIIFLIF